MPRNSIVPIEVITLNSGTRVARPQGQLGTCGFHPYPWDIAIVERGQSYIEAFLTVNPTFVAKGGNDAI